MPTRPDVTGGKLARMAVPAEGFATASYVVVSRHTPRPTYGGSGGNVRCVPGVWRQTSPISSFRATPPAAGSTNAELGCRRPVRGARLPARPELRCRRDGPRRRRGLARRGGSRGGRGRDGPRAPVPARRRRAAARRFAARVASRRCAARAASRRCAASRRATARRCAFAAARRVRRAFACRKASPSAASLPSAPGAPSPPAPGASSGTAPPAGCGGPGGVAGTTGTGFAGGSAGSRGLSRGHATMTAASAASAPARATLPQRMRALRGAGPRWSIPPIGGGAMVFAPRSLSCAAACLPPTPSTTSS